MRTNTKRLAAMSIATAAVAAGMPATADAAANPNQASVEGIISSYLGPLGLRDDFNKYLRDQNSVHIKLTDIIITAFYKYTNDLGLQPPPGLGGGGSD